ncbi:MAG: flagellar basal body rod protein FlgC [Planctomycetota bacterium]
MANAIDISTSGLVAQRTRLNTIASNIANVSTTRDVNGNPNPYVRKRAIFQVGMPGGQGEGVRVAAINEDTPGTPGTEPFRIKYEPGHVDADAQGYVRYPNVDLTRELVNALEAARAYEANVQAVEAAKTINTQVSRLLE